MSATVNNSVKVSKDYTYTVPVPDCNWCTQIIRYHVFARPGTNVLSLTDTTAICGDKTVVFYYNPADNQVLPEKNLGYCDSPEMGDGEENPDEKSGGSSSCQQDYGTDPISGATGNNFVKQVDYWGGGPFPLRFIRYYNSATPLAGLSGMWDSWNRWRTNYDRTLRPIDQSTLHAKRPDGRVYVFTKDASGNWQAEPDVPARVSDLAGGGYQYALPDATIEAYNAAGDLLSISRLGLSQTMAYDSAGRLASVTDHAGRMLQFAYDSATGYLSTVTTPGGQVISYAYNANKTIASVTYPNQKTRVYTYGDTSSTNMLLLGIDDESGNRYSTWTYDSSGRGISSDIAGTRHMSLTYNSNGTTTITDPLGQARTYTFITTRKVKRLTNVNAACDSCGGPVQSTTYNSNGYVSGITDFMGNSTTYARNSRGLATSITEASGTPLQRLTSVDWHATFGLPTLITQTGKTTAFTYADDGRMLTKTETDTNQGGQSRTWTYTYNALNLLASIDGPRTDVSDLTTFTYDTNGNLATITDAGGNVTTIDSYDAQGQPISITDPNGVTTTYTYDFRNNVLTSTQAGRATSYSYNDVGKLTRVTMPGGSYLNYAYDTARRLTEVSDNLGNRIQYTLDAMGNRTAEQTYDPSSQLKKQLSRSISQMNRLAAVLNAAGQATNFTYDNNGKLTSITDPLNKTTSLVYDQLRRLIQTTDALSGLTQLAYDSQDHVISVTDPRGLSTTYAYDGLGRQTQTVSPDTGTTAYASDLAGNRTTRSDANNITTTYAYDALNRLTGLSFPDTSQNIAYAYDQGTYGKGRLTGMSDPTGFYSFTYDQWGNRVSDAKTVLGVNYVIAYTYDSDNRLTGLTYPSGRVVQYVRDAAGRVTSVLTDGGNTVVAQNLAYLPFGPFTSAALGNGLSVSRSFDQNYWLSAMSVGGVQDLAYTRNALGHITAITDNLVPGQSQTFTYDDIYRLAAATGGYGTLGYSYDANGNRLTQTVNGQTDTYAYVTGSNRLQAITGVNPESFSHDAVGNVASRNNMTLAYDQNQRMVQAVVGGLNTTNYGINGLGQRVIKDNAAGVVVYHFDKEGRLLAETSSAGATVKEYIWLEGRLLAVVDSSGLVFAATSHRGEPVALSNASGTVVWTASAQPFGQAQVNEDPDNDGVLYHLNLRLPGQYFTAETGLHYNYFRFYASDLGRYLQADPIGLAGGTNLYEYVKSDPANAVDPSGLKVFLVWRPLKSGLGPIGYHTAISVNGVIYGYHPDTGVTLENPDDYNVWGSHIVTIYSDNNYDQAFLDYLQNAAAGNDPRFTKYTYSLFGNNCMSFADIAIQEAPSWGR